MYCIPGPSESNEWFAFRVRPRHEKQVSIALRQKGLAEFLPLYKSRRQWADRIQVVEMPLFPGYIFCSTARSSIAPVLMTSGVIDVVRAGNHALAADKAEIEALQKTVGVECAAGSVALHRSRPFESGFHFARSLSRSHRHPGRGSAFPSVDPFGQSSSPLGSGRGAS